MAKFKEGEIQISKINHFIRRERNQEGFKNLVKSIQNYGLLIPVTVLEEKDGSYLLIKGEGRVNAHKALQRATIKAFIFDSKDWDDKNKIVDWLVENKMRQQLSSFDKAQLLKLAKDSGTSLIQEAQKLKINPVTAKQYVTTIEQASDTVIDAVKKNKMSFTQAKELVAGIKDKNSQGTVAKLILEDNLPLEDSRVIIRKAQGLEKERKGSISLKELRSSLLDISKERRDLSQILNKTNTRIELLRNAISVMQEDTKFLVLLKEANISNYKEE